MTSPLSTVPAAHTVLSWVHLPQRPYGSRGPSTNKRECHWRLTSQPSDIATINGGPIPALCTQRDCTPPPPPGLEAEAPLGTSHHIPFNSSACAPFFVPWPLSLPAGYAAFIPASARPTAQCQYHPSGTTSQSLRRSSQKRCQYRPCENPRTSPSCSTMTPSRPTLQSLLFTKLRQARTRGAW